MMDYQSVLKELNEKDKTMSRYERADWDAFLRDSGFRIGFPFVHITGTNGKGSTGKYLYEIYRAAGYRTALFHKPYFEKPNEMIVYDGKEISDDDFARIYEGKRDLFNRHDLSSFEIATYIAFAYFNEKNPDVAIIETGMGGTTDSTNIPTAIPLLSIVTTVSLEHTAFLGRTVSEIAENKGGIIKRQSRVLVGQLEESADDTLRAIARRKECEYFVVDECHHVEMEDPHIRFDYRPYVGLQILSGASYQLKNAALAIEASNILKERLPVDEFAVRKGLLNPPLPGRFERHGNIILDAAHNPEAINALMDSLAEVARGKHVHVLFAAMKDKNIAVEFPRIGRDVADITLTTFDSPRARDEMDYFLYVGDYAYNPDYRLALNDLIAKYSDDDELILVTGSLAFVGEVRRYLIEVLGQ